MVIKKSLAETYPEIAAEAHGWDPTQISPGSGKKLNWKCSNSHVWDALVSNRTNKGYGCPYCSNKRILPGFNDLKTKFPEIAAEADGWDPTVIAPMSNKKMPWKCKSGHAWDAVIGNRTFKKYGCPICSNQQLLSGFNDLKTKFPEIAEQAHGWDPSIVAPFNNDSKLWKCTKGHIWSSNVANRTIRGDGCAICSSHKTLEGYNDLMTTHPELAREAFGWNASDLSQASNKKRNWMCANGHVWEAPPSRRTSGSGCPVCSNKVVKEGFNDLATDNGDLALEAYKWDPKTLTRSSNKVMMWQCKLGHLWKASVGSRTAGNGCPTCGGKKALAGFNDLATKRPEIAKEAYGWDPSTVTEGSTSKKQDWKCSEGHIYKAAVANRSRGQGCPYCAFQKVLPGFNDLATTHPHLVAFVDGWDASSVIAGTDKKLTWKCELGHYWKRSGTAMVGSKGCPVCNGQQVLAGFNDLATMFPEIAKEAHGWDPTTVMPGSEKKLKWKCEEGHTYSTSIYHRTGKIKTGCPTCSKSGFDPNSDGWLYFLRHDNWRMLQIGITNVPDDRLGRHKRLGWTVLELRGPMDGLSAQEYETSILRMLRKNGAKLSSEEVAGKFDGYSEAWIESSFPVNSIRELISLTNDFEDSVKASKTKKNKK
jgi:hypothetical protein